jgi:hypothetical protein
MFSIKNLNNKNVESNQKFDYYYDEWCKTKKEYKKLSAKLQRTMNKYTHLSNYVGRLYEQWFTFDAITPADIKNDIKNKISKISHLMHKTLHETEVLNLELDINNACSTIHANKFDKHLLKIKTIHHITRKNSNVRSVSVMQQKDLESETCCICLETHTLKDIVTTCCGHTLGKSCFEEIIHKHYYADTEITCPLCRKQSLSFNIYRKTM